MINLIRHPNLLLNYKINDAAEAEQKKNHIFLTSSAMFF